MKVDIRWKGIPKSEALADYVRNLLEQALKKFGGSLRRVVVRFEDENGPKGGVDKRCTVEATGDFGARRFEARDIDFYVAAYRALEMSQRSLARLARRNRERRIWFPLLSSKGGLS